VWDLSQDVYARLGHQEDGSVDGSHKSPLFGRRRFAITNVYTDRRRSLRSDGTYNLDGTRNYLAQVDRMYNPKYFSNLTAEVLKSNFYMDSVFAIPMLCMMCEVTVFLDLFSQ
jgi:hypothetical protein